ncbi:MAG: hypothetical protein MJ252_13780 [archaeon]|nr:hypothetical protein [archaeon]
MDSFQDFYFRMPPFTRYAMTTFLLVAFDISYLNAFGIMYLPLDYKQVFKKFQIWRLYANYIVCGGFSPMFPFFMIMAYMTLNRLERFYIARRRYAEFIMLIFYLMTIIDIIYLVFYFLLPSLYSVYHCRTILYSLMYIDSKRNPDDIIRIYFLTFKSNLFIF